ncbi:LacI family DNA-binding transcriptional regulator [Roseomonas sp. M0104]|uniref:LacI family DNA-binding transcriptional regulator n=2 Tax=Teichococcus coralli TaxID=2545983 RepID=A0A845BEB2_9PROT|nr:LacI family DNA-binding transcriptional regulator [Pseudoroseomonas coralli]
MPFMQRIRIKDVAKEAGVALSTAALALRDDTKLREETRRLVRDAAARLGYVYDRSAAVMRSGKSHTIGLLVCEITNPFYAELTAGVEEALDEAGFVVMLANTSESITRQRRMLERFREQPVDGVLIMPATGTPPSLLEDLEQWRVPHATVVRGFRRGAHTGPDNRAGTRMATEHLLALGHRRIAFLGGLTRNSVSRERWDGYFRAMTKAGLAPEQLCCRTDIGEAAGVAEALPADGPTALVCFNDSVAFGATLGLLRSGRMPGRDVAVIGFDDIREAAAWFPALTTVRVSPREIGRAAARVLLERIADPAAAPRREILAPTLVVRESCGAHLRWKG